MITPTAPRKIEWSGPEGWTVWVDEDGCHVRTPKGDGMEQCDVERLFSLWTEARAMFIEGLVPAPRVPSAEEVRQESFERHERRIQQRAIRAISNEFNPPATTPF